MSTTIPVPNIELEIRCATCSSDLTASHNPRTDVLIVDPCDKPAKKKGKSTE